MPPRPPPEAYRKAALVFAAGCLVIAATTWDVHRNIQLNDRPVTPQQQAALEEWLANWKQPGGGSGKAH